MKILFFFFGSDKYLSYSFFMTFIFPIFLEWVKGQHKGKLITNMSNHNKLLILFLNIKISVFIFYMYVNRNEWGFQKKNKELTLTFFSFLDRFIFRPKIFFNSFHLQLKYFYMKVFLFENTFRVSPQGTATKPIYHSKDIFFNRKVFFRLKEMNQWNIFVPTCYLYLSNFLFVFCF